MLSRMSQMKIIIILLVFLIASTQQAVGMVMGEPYISFRFCQNQDIIVVGQVVDIQLAPGVEVYNGDFGNISGARVYAIRVGEVLKGTGIRTSQELPVLVLPWVSTSGVNLPPGMTYQQIFEYYKKNGKYPFELPPQTENYPPIRLNQPRIFAFRVADFDDGRWGTSWLGAKQFAAGRTLYRYTNDFQITDQGNEVAVVKRYLEIGKIPGPMEQNRELVQFSLELIRNRKTPVDIASGAIFGLQGQFGSRTEPNAPWHIIAEILTPQEMSGLVEVCTDRTRSTELRTGLFILLKELISTAHKMTSPSPFLQVLKNRTEETELRTRAVDLLDEIGGLEVQQTFQEILQAAPSGESENLLWRLKQSRLLKSER